MSGSSLASIITIKKMLVSVSVRFLFLNQSFQKKMDLTPIELKTDENLNLRHYLHLLKMCFFVF